jgi:anti-sigma factor RsiW
MSHERVVALLAAYTDDELPLEIRREVGAHLAECSRCVQELRVQSALRHRLGAEESALEPSDALMRLEGHVEQLGRRGWEQRASAVQVDAAKRPVLRHLLVTWSGWSGRGPRRSTACPRRPLLTAVTIAS